MATSFATTLANKTETEFNNFNGHHETTSKMANRIRQYWNGTVGGFTSVGVAWSAVFVSFMVKNAGASATEFKFSARHAEFVKWACDNASAGTGLFRAFDITVYAPKLGDIIQNNRNGNNFDFAHARSHNSYESHSAIVVEEGTDGSGRYVRTVGGNEGDTVGDAIVRLNAAGLIRQPSSDPKRYICVIQNLK